MAILSDRLISSLMCLNPHLCCITYPNRGRSGVKTQSTVLYKAGRGRLRLYAYSRMRRTPDLSWSVWLGTGGWVVFLPHCGVVGP